MIYLCCNLHSKIQNSQTIGSKLLKQAKITRIWQIPAEKKVSLSQIGKFQAAGQPGSDCTMQKPAGFVSKSFENFDITPVNSHKVNWVSQSKIHCFI